MFEWNRRRFCSRRPTISASLAPLLSLANSGVAPDRNNLLSMTGPPRIANNGRAINGVKALPGAASSHGPGLLLQLGSDFLEELSCGIGEGSCADIARFGMLGAGQERAVEISQKIV